MTNVTRDEAWKLIQDCEKHAIKLGICIATSIVDSGGNLVAFSKMDGTQLASLTISQSKAYTALSWKRPSGALFAIAQPGAGGFGINTIDSRFVLCAGGVPIKVGDALLGGIGVSGGTSEEDEECAIQALINNQFTPPSFPSPC